MHLDYPLTQEQIQHYRREGFIQLPDVLAGDDLRRMRDAVAAAVAAETVGDNRPVAAKGAYEQLFIQKVNLWQRFPDVREFVLSRRFGNLAARLMGAPARLWHDQALFKEPHEGKRTPWHQDTHYWPHREKKLQTSIWIALRDATTENGCMSFMPGTQALDKIESVKLEDPQDLFKIAPQLQHIKPVTIELPAGSCTFHNGFTFHYAGPNRSDRMREAFAIIYMPDGTTYSGDSHIVTDNQGLTAGQKLDTDLFPLVSQLP
jgi:ectoine hydroxylase-related dioxygenase (phytanoyl-CoA dioxygenase family)